MGMWFCMLCINLMFPAIMLISGMLFMKKPPKKRNYLYGYRTAMSMKNEDTWVFAHNCAGAFWWKWGLIDFVIAIVPMLLIFGQPIDILGPVSAVIVCLLAILLLAVFPYTEKALRNTFDKDGNRKAEAHNENL